jgi:NADPH:quinone reductase-like Zn-dependent oxidoreductase
MPSNRAVLVPSQGQPREIREVLYQTAKEHEIVIKNRAIALNPVD